MGPIKIHNVEIYAHAQDSNAYRFCQLNLYERCFTVFRNSCEFSSLFCFLFVFVTNNGNTYFHSSLVILNI